MVTDVPGKEMVGERDKDNCQMQEREESDNVLEKDGGKKI